MFMLVPMLVFSFVLMAMFVTVGMVTFVCMGVFMRIDMGGMLWSLLFVHHARHFDSVGVYSTNAILDHMHCMLR